MAGSHERSREKGNSIHIQRIGGQGRPATNERPHFKGSNKVQNTQPVILLNIAHSKNPIKSKLSQAVNCSKFKPLNNLDLSRQQKDDAIPQNQSGISFQSMSHEVEKSEEIIIFRYNDPQHPVLPIEKECESESIGMLPEDIPMEQRLESYKTKLLIQKNTALNISVAESQFAGIEKQQNQPVPRKSMRALNQPQQFRTLI
ncbi:hypothetical protein FGO68_gene7296 [Halteria grandinella]|uniref:Uncharacterized protein n=1 Tax=Halteria grandinella TaxID=5974 RepID=A0A8J8P4T3_HALGN|nr:hypothetical protein FGO68_gene7296 [Halteria grandinella]